MSKHYRQLNMDFECLVRGNRPGQAMPNEEIFNARCEAYRDMFRKMDGKSFRECRDMINNFRSDKPVSIDEKKEDIRRHENMKQILKREKIK